MAGVTQGFVCFGADLWAWAVVVSPHDAHAAPSIPQGWLSRHELRRSSRAGREDRRERIFLDDVDGQDSLRTQGEAGRKRGLVARRKNGPAKLEMAGGGATGKFAKTANANQHRYLRQAEPSNQKHDRDGVTLEWERTRSEPNYGPTALRCLAVPYRSLKMR